MLAQRASDYSCIGCAKEDLPSPSCTREAWAASQGLQGVAYLTMASCPCDKLRLSKRRFWSLEVSVMYVGVALETSLFVASAVLTAHP